jgi:hypothetical protein
VLTDARPVTGGENGLCSSSEETAEEAEEEADEAEEGADEAEEAADEAEEAEEAAKAGSGPCSTAEPYAESGRNAAAGS